ncbi:disease resistance-like protein DSC1 [Ricinus communis]|uniref:ADP-ribosyl cyclase/cyclic ADP-ribose hydrolase n=1 Tax=Ricinus communis TaxID=3988 RepID=B9RBV2_RICCO|nr:disease resistance-like protein DSC1 [Ricinus communis]EEF51023.1 leucine-rich repeat-containing protein, putative [Ricinus communis]|eukprot:XP_002509636.1 disease resistance-like protein DSC1 [Ricinus communis]
MATSLSTSHTTHQWKYDVFLSFRGEDTRDNFTSHLFAALSRKSVITFMDNNDLHVGEEITPAISKAIEESKIAIVIFSERYAFSRWCLNEIVRIIECKETCGQLVLPVFYHVGPSDVSVFAEAFPSYDQFEKVQKWKNALSKAANLSAFDSRVTRPESKLVDEIVMYTLKQLKQSYSSDVVEGIVGVDSRIEQIKELLSIGSVDVRFLGIWGMGGIGKTTLAEAVFYQIAYQFEGSCFLANVRGNFEKNGGLARLQEELLSKTLEKRDFKIDTPNIGYSFWVKQMLKHRRVLIVVDDANDSEQLDLLVGSHDWFGPGSRIIVTSRDKQVLTKIVDDIYEVKELVHHEALQLFNQTTFKKKCVPEDYSYLSDLVIEYAKGVPLALKVLGSFLFGKSKTEWESALDKLKKAPHRATQNVLKISYDGLDAEEKNIFLDIACFFRGESVEMVTKILDGCGFSTKIGLCLLVDKSLITILNDKVEMHDLLQEMGKEIVLQESKQPSQRTRLWNHEDILHVFSRNLGTETIEGMCLNTSMINKIELNSNAFGRMYNLRFLKFYQSYIHGGFKECTKIRLPQGLDSLSNELRYLHWHGYPLKSLPARIHLMNLVVLVLPYSKVKRLWKGCKDLKKLKVIDLSYSQALIRITELTTASNLSYMKLSGCKNLRSMPSTTRWKSLSTLEMNYCTKLESLPSSICKLKSLESLSLCGCSNLQSFPEILESMDRLKVLVLNGTAIKELPSSIERLKGLSSIYLENCRNLAHLPESFCNLKALYWLFLTFCPKLEKLPEKLSNLTTLEDLSVGVCNLLKLPSHMNHLSCISKLDLSGNYFDQLPSFKYLLNLRCLDISSCRRLRSLPEVPHSLTDIDAHDCRSLETISGLKQIFQLKYTHTFYDKKIIFTSCFKMDESAWSDFLADAQFWIQKVAMRAKDEESFSIWYPGSKIPKWFGYQSEGSSIVIQLHPRSHKHNLLGFTLCVVLAFEDEFEYHNSFFDVLCVYQLKNYRGEYTDCKEVYSSRTHVSGKNKYVGSDHVILFYDPNFSSTEANELSYNEASFEFYWQNNESCCMQSSMVKKCAAIPLYSREEECCNRLEGPIEIGINPMEEEAIDHKRYWDGSESSDEEREDRYPKKLKLMDGMIVPS